MSLYNLIMHLFVCRYVQYCLYNTKQVEDWRPISLLNTLYKVGTKANANRVTMVLPLILFLKTSLDSSG